MSKNHPLIYEKIYSAALRLLYPLTPNEMYTTIVNEAKKLVNAKHGTIFLLEANKLKRVYASTPIIYQVKPRKKGNTFRVYDKLKPYILSYEQLMQLHPEFKKIHVGSDMGIPLTYGNKTIGVLSV